MKLKLKNKRNGYSIIGVVMSLALIGALGAVSTPSISNYYDKIKVEELVAKEKMIKQLYELYYNNSGGNLALVPNNIDALIAKAKTDKIIPDNYSTSNGFGGVIDLSVDGALISVGTTLPAEKIYAKNTYASILSASTVDYVADGAKGSHVYTMVGAVLEHAVRKSAFSQNATDSNATSITTAGLASIKTDVTNGIVDPTTLAGQEWWDYDPFSDTYTTYTWDVASADFLAGAINSANLSGVTSSVSQYYGTVDSVSATSVVQGSTLLDSSSGSVVEYVAIGGAWVATTVAISGGTDTNSSSGGSSSGSVVYEIASDINDLLDRRTTPQYFNSASASRVLVPGLFNNNVEFQRWPNFWTSTAMFNVPNYEEKGVSTLLRTIYVAASITDLPPAEKGSVAFLTSNNNDSATENNGYNGGIQFDTSTTYEAVHNGTNWVDVIPSISDLVKHGKIALNYYVIEASATFTNMGLADGVTDNITYWQNIPTLSELLIIATKGDRTNLPVIDIGNEALYAYAVSYNVGTEATFVTDESGNPLGIDSTFTKKDSTGLIIGKLKKWTKIPTEYRGLGDTIFFQPPTYKAYLYSNPNVKNTLFATTGGRFVLFDIAYTKITVKVYENDLITLVYTKEFLMPITQGWAAFEQLSDTQFAFATTNSSANQAYAGRISIDPADASNTTHDYIQTASSQYNIALHYNKSAGKLYVSSVPTESIYGSNPIQHIYAFSVQSYTFELDDLILTETADATLGVGGGWYYTYSSTYGTGFKELAAFTIEYSATGVPGMVAYSGKKASGYSPAYNETYGSGFIPKISPDGTKTVYGAAHLGFSKLNVRENYVNTAINLGTADTVYAAEFLNNAMLAVTWYNPVCVCSYVKILNTSDYSLRDGPFQLPFSLGTTAFSASNRTYELKWLNEQYLVLRLAAGSIYVFEP